MKKTFLMGVEYTLEKDGRTFTGKLINRTFGLGPALSGFDDTGLKCHLPMSNIKKWKVVKEVTC